LRGLPGLPRGRLIGSMASTASSKTSSVVDVGGLEYYRERDAPSVCHNARRFEPAFPLSVVP